MVNEVAKLPTTPAERRIAYERKAHRAALKIKKARNKKQAISTFLHYLKLSI